MIKEVWKPVKGFGKYYEVSNCGRVRSKDRYSENRFSKWLRKGRVLKEVYDKRGYPMVHLINDKVSLTRRIHVLVWDAFGKQKRSGRRLQVDHKDENKKNNHINNLQLLTNRENVTKRFVGQRLLPTGVYRQEGTKKYMAQISINGKSIYLGYFETVESARRAYKNAKLGPKGSK